MSFEFSGRSRLDTVRKLAGNFVSTVSTGLREDSDNTPFGVYRITHSVVLVMVRADGRHKTVLIKVRSS